jgi:hypothetical protein
MTDSIYCVYKTTYSGTLLPPYYIGSSSIKKINSGYRGSVASNEFKDIWSNELEQNPHLFTTEILSLHEDRQLATEEELKQQILNDVVNNPLFINKSLAKPNGFFGMDVSGENNPMYGRSRKGEKHKGGDNISKSRKKYFESENGEKEKERSKKRFTENNPSKSKEVMDKAKDTWKRTGRNTGEKSPRYGKPGTLSGKTLYNDGTVVKSFVEGSQPEGWTLGRIRHVCENCNKSYSDSEFTKHKKNCLQKNESMI